MFRNITLQQRTIPLLGESVYALSQAPLLPELSPSPWQPSFGSAPEWGEKKRLGSICRSKSLLAFLANSLVKHFSLELTSASAHSLPIQTVRRRTLHGAKVGGDTGLNSDRKWSGSLLLLKVLESIFFIFLNCTNNLRNMNKRTMD